MSSIQIPLTERKGSRFFGQGGRLSSVLIGGDHHRLMSGNALLIARLVTSCPPMLLFTNYAETVMGTEDRESDKPHSYTAYGFRTPAGQGTLPGLNGEYLDQMTGCHPLGRGKRWYSPFLMRFLSPDVLSPFYAGGLNGYSYCAGDPVNKHDPSGHVGEFLKRFQGISNYLKADPKRRVTGALFNPKTGELKDFRVKIVDGKVQTRLTDFDAGERAMYVDSDRQIFIDERFSYEDSSNYNLRPFLIDHQGDLSNIGFVLKTINPRKGILTKTGVVVQPDEIHLSQRGVIETSQGPIHRQLLPSDTSPQPRKSWLHNSPASLKIRDEIRRNM